MQLCMNNACHIWRHVKQQLDIIDHEHDQLAALVWSQQLAMDYAATQCIVNYISIAILKSVQNMQNSTQVLAGWKYQNKKMPFFQL